MIIKKISIQNFRSYGSDTFTISLSPNTNTVIGENNVGKTTIFEALKKILILNNRWDNEDYFLQDATKEIHISLECILDREQIQRMIILFNLPYSEEEFTKNLSNEIEYSYTRIRNRDYYRLKIGDLQIENERGHFHSFVRDTGFIEINWFEILNEIKKDKSIPLKKVCETLLFVQNGLASNSEYGINFQSSDFFKTLISIIASKIIILEEFREKPQIKANKSLISPTGKDLANILDGLKNGPDDHRKKYAEIQRQFQNLFPHLKIEFLGVDEDKKIEIQKGQIFSTTNYIGSGILQTLFLLTHMITHPDKVLCIDTPEIQLHPHVQRRLGKLLQASKGVQIILITHSQYFLPISNDSRLVRFIQCEGKTNAIFPSEGFFTDFDFSIYDQILNIDNKEFFFSRLVLLVEGLSDQWVMQVFASAEGFDLDEHGISIIPVNGKNNFLRYPKILEGYQIPWVLMADKDKKEEILPILAKLKEQYPEYKSFLLQGEIEQQLDREFISEGKKLFGDGSDKNKPLVARYAAKRMIETGKQVPDEIKDVITALKNEVVQYSTDY
ncbi:AAA family ATPase [Candidatus Pacearchaeota archaeon]|nr:AAA family ATPase [Candidatus Pacearchaeota archaeon]